MIDSGAVQLDHPSIASSSAEHLPKQGYDELVTRLHSVQARQVAHRERELRRVLRVLVSACLAVEYAHRRGVVHGGLEPWMVLTGEFGEVFVVGWEAANDQPDPGDELGDVFALGTLLYQTLTGEGPFAEEGLRNRATPPAVRRPDLQIPLRLDAICMKAIEIDRGNRLASARDLAEALEEWLDGVEDVEDRRRKASWLVEQAILRSAAYLGRRQQYRHLEDQAETERRQVADAQSDIEDKRRVWQLEDEARQLKRDALTAFADAERFYHKALEFDSVSVAARRGLADLHYDRLLFAERPGRGSPDEIHYYRTQLEAFNDGRYDDDLAGLGSLRVIAHPTNAEVYLFRHVERDRRLVAVPWRTPEGEAADAGAIRSPSRNDDSFLGYAPLFRLDLPMGSYLVVLRAEGKRDARFPVHIGRNGHQEVAVRLYTDDQIGGGYLLVPRGPCEVGGDAQAPGAWPRRTVEVPDFVITEYPVTRGEYLEFLNAVGRHYPNTARAHAPRREDSQETHWIESSPGVWSLPTNGGPEDLPIVGVSWQDAAAYCDWLSVREGRKVHLPREVQWEKAARGADGRTYPWGSGFDPSFLQHGLEPSREGHNHRCVVSEFPVDASPYGVRGLAGNVMEWCEDYYSHDSAWRVIRGGSFVHDAPFCRSARRQGSHPHRPRHGHRIPGRLHAPSLSRSVARDRLEGVEDRAA